MTGRSGDRPTIVEGFGEMSPRPPEQRIAPVIEAVDLDATVRWFADELGFRIETVSPADAPSEISMSGLGGRIVIRRADRDASTLLVCASADDDVLARNPLRAPNGAVVEIRRADTRPVVPDAQPSRLSPVHFPGTAGPLTR